MLRFRATLPFASRSMVRRGLTLLTTLLVLASAAGASPVAAGTPQASASTRTAASQAAGGASGVGAASRSYRRACAEPARGQASCLAIVRTDVPPRAVHQTNAQGVDVIAAVPADYGYVPSDLQSAYGLTAASATSGAGATVAVIDAHDDPTAESDLATYRAAVGLPPCSSSGASPCFRKVNQRGGSSPLPTVDEGWSIEISLDLDMVSAICPNCSILLVEADSATLDDLGTAVNYAVSAGAKYVSNSYGGIETSNAPLLDTAYYKHAGVVITASTGDSGFQGYLAGGQTGNEYPSVSPWIVAVGGTTLSRAANARGWTESAWAGTGSGCSRYEPRPAWQPQSVTQCATRMVADVSAVADPKPGVAVVYKGAWQPLGGTSASAPIVAAAFALAGTPSASIWPGSYPYGRHGLNDAVGGSNYRGACSPALWCAGVVGYDGPTGLGTPNGVLPFTTPTTPDKPTGVGAVAGDASVAATWTAPSSDGGSPITSYTATASPGGATCSSVPASTTCVIASLTNGVGYSVTVTASNAVGTSQTSDPSATVTPRAVPGQPQSVAVVPGDRLVIVSWTAPISDGGSTISGYTVTASPGPATCAWSSGPFACTVTDLTNGTAYTFSVTATNSVGTGPPSVSATAIPRTTPGPPTAVLARAGNASAQVFWQAPVSNGGSAITSYVVTANPGGQTCMWSGGPLDCTVTGLVNDSVYTFTVIAVNAAGSGPASDPSAPVLPSTVPDPPTGVVATPNASVLGALSVTWSAPNDNGSPIITYQAVAYDSVTFAEVGRCSSVAVAGAAAAPGCLLSGLGDGRTVVARVSASNANGEGPLSSASGPATTPIRASLVGLPAWTLQSSVPIAWKAAPGGVATGFDVRYRRATWNGGFGSAVTWRAATAATSGSFGLAAGSTYCFSVRAIDPQGVAGPWSSETCTTAPLDDRSLSRSTSWVTGTGTSYFHGTWTRSSTYGARLVRTSVRAKSIVLVATTCPTCGSVRVYLGSTYLATVNLTSSTTVNRRVIVVKRFTSVRTGTVTVKLSTGGRRVLIDGLGVSAV